MGVRLIRSRGCIWRHLPLPDVHPHAELAAAASEAAGAQGRFWDMHDLLFSHHDQEFDSTR
jgi:protein-disulfide isomerase